MGLRCRSIFSDLVHVLGLKKASKKAELPKHCLRASPQHRPPVDQLVDFLQVQGQLTTPVVSWPTGEAATPSNLIHVGSEHSTADVWHQRGHACQDNEGSMVTDAPWQYCGLRSVYYILSNNHVNRLMAGHLGPLRQC